MNQFKKTVQQRSQLYNEYIKLINGLLGLTEKQVLVLSKIMELEESTPVNKKLFSRDNRKEILETCKINECNLSTYLTLFKSKGILTDIAGVWSVNSAIYPNIIDNKIQVIFKLDYNGVSNNKE